MGREKVTRSREDAIRLIEEALESPKAEWERLDKAGQDPGFHMYSTMTPDDHSSDIFDYDDKIFVMTRFSSRRTFIVTIQKEPVYREERFWSREAVIKMCIRNNWYTCGTNEDYGKMLDYVDSVDHPRTEHIAKVAKNIYDHSEADELIDVTYIMEEIANHAMITMFWEVKPDE